MSQKIIFFKCVVNQKRLRTTGLGVGGHSKTNVTLERETLDAFRNKKLCLKANLCSYKTLSFYFMLQFKAYASRRVGSENITDLPHIDLLIFLF